MSNEITRRDALALGVSAAALAATGASAQTASAIKAADVPAPSLPIEKGASLAHAAAGALRASRRGRVPRQCRKVHREDRRRGQGRFRRLGGHQPADRGDLELRRRPRHHHRLLGRAAHLCRQADRTDRRRRLSRQALWRLAVRWPRNTASAHKSNAWIGLPFGATSGPLIYRKSILKAVGFDKVPEDHAGLLDLCQKLQKAGKPAGFALGNAVGDGNGFANWLLWSHNASLLDEEGNVIINSKETVAALKYLKKLYPTFIAGTPSWNDVSNNRAYSSQEISLTANGVSLYFSLKNDPATAPIAEDSEHQFLPKGLAKSPPMGGL